MAAQCPEVAEAALRPVAAVVAAAHRDRNLGHFRLSLLTSDVASPLRTPFRTHCGSHCVSAAGPADDETNPSGADPPKSRPVVCSRCLRSVYEGMTHRVGEAIRRRVISTWWRWRRRWSLCPGYPPKNERRNRDQRCYKDCGCLLLHDELLGPYRTRRSW